MATYLLDRDHAQHHHATLGFDELWEHYLATGYIYPEKAVRLDPYMPAIRRSWPRFMRGPDALFQLYIGRRGDKISATHSVFRDTASGMTMQHASSDGDPPGLLACMRAELIAFPETGCDFFGTYYRPENRWTSRICKVVSQVFPIEHIDLRTRDFVVWRPGPEHPSLPRQTVQELSAEEAGAAAELAAAAVGELRAQALDLVQDEDPTSPELSRIYSEAGATRRRFVWAVYREGQMVGLALRYYGSPINSGLLCQRAEILVHPDLDAAEANSVVFDLASAIQMHAQATDYLVPLLLDSSHVGAALEAGFETTGRQYSHTIWRMRWDEGGDSIETGVASIDAFYKRVRRQADRLQKRAARVG